MPELPEVEFARKILERGLLGKTVHAIALGERRILGDATTLRHARDLTGRRVRAIERRGKWLRLSFSGEPKRFLFSHLGMTGRWIVAPDEARFEKARLDVRGKRGAITSARYLDPRMFGAIWITDGDIPAWTELGPDPITDGIDEARLAAALERRRGPIKVALLDQSLCAGVGNIHAIEALFRARIDPRRPAKSLSRSEVKRLVRGVLGSLGDALASQEGAETLPYLGEGAHVENPFAIYGREGQPCPRCRTPLAKLVLAGRGTVLCGRCQT